MTTAITMAMTDPQAAAGGAGVCAGAEGRGTSRRGASSTAASHADEPQRGAAVNRRGTSEPKGKKPGQAKGADHESLYAPSSKPKAAARTLRIDRDSLPLPHRDSSTILLFR